MGTRERVHSTRGDKVTRGHGDKGRCELRGHVGKVTWGHGERHNVQRGL